MLEKSTPQTRNFTFFWAWGQILSDVDTKGILKYSVLPQYPRFFLQAGIAVISFWIKVDFFTSTFSYIPQFLRQKV